MPVNWYAALVLIVLLGIGSVVLARHNYFRTAAAAQPFVGQTWHAGLAIDICGTVEPALTASASSSTTGLTTTGSGVLLIAPKTGSEAGNNATLGKFASEYTGMVLNNSSIKYPGSTQYSNGEVCAKGTPDAGKKGVVVARSWILGSSTGSGSQVKETGGHTTAQPKGLKLENRQLITVGFVPTGTKLPKPPGTTIVALIDAISGTTPVTSTTAPATTTTSPGSVTTTTVPATTTSTPASTTTTTKPATTTTSSGHSSTTTTKPGG